MEGLFAPWHIVIVLVIALLVFGPKRLPQMGHSLGKSITGFRQGLQEAKEEFSGVMKETTDASEPTETKVAGSSAPAAPVATVLAEPTIDKPTVETIEKPAEPAVRL